MAANWGPAPVVLTGDPQTDWVIFFVGYVALLGVAYYWLRYFRLAREGVRRVLSMMATAVIVFCLSMAVLLGDNFRPDSAAPLSAVIGLFVAILITEERSRYIPASVRRKVIARDLKGEQFDSAKHHIDHIVPFSRGGSHTADNLRVITKRDNLRKGKRRPKFRELW
jgi:HNH endonuclease